jgi:hypothetical protein
MNNFDKFVDFIDAVFENFLPALIEACSNLSSVLTLSLGGQAWDEFRSIVISAIAARHPRIMIGPIIGSDWLGQR